MYRVRIWLCLIFASSRKSCPSKQQKLNATKSPDGLESYSILWCTFTSMNVSFNVLFDILCCLKTRISKQLLRLIFTLSKRNFFALGIWIILNFDERRRVIGFTALVKNSPATIWSILSNVRFQLYRNLPSKRGRISTFGGRKFVVRDNKWRYWWAILSFLDLFVRLSAMRMFYCHFEIDRNCISHGWKPKIV